MSGDRIHALIARCLTEPSFLQSALDVALGQETGGDGLDGCVRSEAVEAAALVGLCDLKRVSLFRGFITKIKHNSLRIVLPVTLRVLAHIGKEIDFFWYYSPAYIAARAQGPLPVDKQLALVATHLKTFMENFPTSIRIMVIDSLSHEVLLRDLGQTPSQPFEGNSVAIRWRGRFEIRRYSTDVLATVEAFQAGDVPYFSPGKLAREYIIAYWRPYHKGHVSFFEIDEATALLFGFVDGRRTIEDIASSLQSCGLNLIRSVELREFFADASRRGFVNIGDCEETLEEVGV